MKKLFLILFISLVYAPGASSNQWDRLIHAIAKVESNHNPRAVNGKYVGYLQIAPIIVKDCNRILAKKKSTLRFTLQDRYSKEKSIAMFCIYQKFYNPRNSIERAIRLWNGGPHFTVSSTQGYYKKVMKAFKHKRK